MTRCITYDKFDKEDLDDLITKCVMYTWIGNEDKTYLFRFDQTMMFLHVDTSLKAEGMILDITYDRDLWELIDFFTAIERIY
jgi:hypothetical protein